MITIHQIKSYASLGLLLRNTSVARVAIFVVAGLLGLNSVAAEEQTIKRILETENDLVELSVIDGTGGTSHIATGAPGRVTVEATITGFSGRWSQRRIREQLEELAKNPLIKQEGNTIQIGGLPWWIRRDLSISYRITVPPNTNVHAQGPDSVRLQGLVGDLHAIGANTSALEIRGNVTLERAKDVRITDLSGNLHVSGGRVTASNIKGDVNLVRSEYVSIDNVSGEVIVTDRAHVFSLDDVIVDLGMSGL